MRLRLAALALAFALAGCSKVTAENFARIQDGMSERDVQAILGAPSESASVTVLGLSGTSAKWRDGNATITIQFANGKVRLKSFDQAAPGK
jgi:hypothetical protein